MHINGVHPVLQIRELLEMKNLDLYNFSLTFENSLMTKIYNSMKDAFKEVLEEFNVEPTEERIFDLSNIWTKTMNRLEFPTKIMRMLNKLKKKYKLALLTNSDIFSISFVRKKYDIDEYFDVVLISCEERKIKPDREIFKKILDKLELNPEECMMVGDNLYNDIVPAKDFGMKTLLFDKYQRWGNYDSVDIKVNNIDDFVNSLLELKI